MTTTTPTDETAPAALPTSLGERLRGWREILETANPPSSGRMDSVGKWLVPSAAGRSGSSATPSSTRAAPAAC
jgi:hypothetical protein